ncbi:MAG: TonB-dependent receptor [Opitutaceae bacterium]|nr:TonB-dependent receptor [Opitutaceae bacterium]
MKITVATAARRAGLALTWACSATLILAQAVPDKTTEPEEEVITTRDVVKLEDITVATTIESYHQSTSSMAAKLPMEIKEIPISLQIMNASAIMDRNAVTLVDVFGYVVGANQSQGNINGFTFRGFPNTGSYTQNIQFDGLMGPTLKKAATSAANVDSMEFLKGPNGVLYGQMNPGGLLNIVTKSPKEKRESNVRVTAGFYAGEFTDFGDGKVTKSISLDNTGPVPGVKGLYYRIIVDASSAPNSRPGNWSHAYSIYPSLTYKWSPETSFTVKMEASKDNRRQDDGVMPIFTSTTAYGESATFVTAPLNTVYNDNKDTAWDRGQAFATFFRTKLGSDWHVRFQSRSVWHVDQVRELTFNNANTWKNPTGSYATRYSYATPSLVVARQYNNVKNGHRYNFADLNVFRDFKTGDVKHTVIVGVGGGYEEFYNKRLAFGPNQPTSWSPATNIPLALNLFNPILNQVEAYPADGTGATNQQTNQVALGQYISDQIKYGKLNLSLGLRHDHQTVEVTDWIRGTTGNTMLDVYTKQAGAVYALTSTLSTYGSFSQSIKPQTNIAYDINGKTGFPPESGEQLEAGFKFEAEERNLNASIAVYEITRTNVVVPTGQNFAAPTGEAPLGAAISRLDGEQKSTGVELEVQWQPAPNWQMQGGLANSKARITKSERNPTSIGKDLINAPRLTANFWTRYNFTSGALKGLGVGTGIIYVDDAWGGDPTSAVYFKMKSWSRVDASLYYKWKRYDLAVSIQNRLDKRYIASAFSAQVLNVGEQRKITFSAGTKF